MNLTTSKANKNSSKAPLADSIIVLLTDLRVKRKIIPISIGNLYRMKGLNFVKANNISLRFRIQTTSIAMINNKQNKSFLKVTLIIKTSCLKFQAKTIV